MMERESKIARIRALMAKTVAAGCTEAEAQAAAAAVDRLLGQWEIELDELQLKEETPDIRVVTTPRGHAVTRAALGVARFCDCRVWLQGNKDLAYCGLPVDLEIAEYLTMLFMRSMDREAANYTMFNPTYDALSPGGRDDMLFAFRVGMARRLTERLDEMKDARDGVNRSSGRDLVAVKTPMIDAYLASIGLVIGKGSKGRSVRDVAAFEAGRAAGERVAINRAVRVDRRTPIR